MAGKARLMGGSHGSSDREETLRSAIEELMEEIGREGDDPAYPHLDHALLSRLLSQLDRSKDDCIEEYQPTSAEMEAMNRSREESCELSFANKDDAAVVTAEEVVKELRKVRRQNTITHILLSALIVVTTVWQFSEISIILMIKNKFQNPLRAIGGLIFRGLGGSADSNNQEKSPAPVVETTLKVPETSFKIPDTPFKLPEIPRLELKPFLGLDNTKS